MLILNCRSPRGIVDCRRCRRHANSGLHEYATSAASVVHHGLSRSGYPGRNKSCRR